MNRDEAKALLVGLYETMAAAADPRTILAAHLPPPPDAGRVAALCAGKAGAAMAVALEAAWGAALGERLFGLAVVPDGYALPTDRIEVVEASHPTPDARGAEAARRMLALAGELGARDTALALISGGGSALLTAPAPGVTLEEKRALNKALLASGARIDEINAVRKHLSRIKGGRLAAAASPAQVLTLAVSDVPGDSFDVIASGPTVPDASRLVDARAVLYRYGVEASPGVLKALGDRANETPKPGDPLFERAERSLIATPGRALEAAAAAARAQDLRVVSLGADVEGDATAVAREHARRIRELAASGEPTLLLSGGELTVTLTAPPGLVLGAGGPNREYALALAFVLDGAPDIHALAGDTDGADGGPDAAGAFIAPDTLARAKAAGLDVGEALARHDSGGFFAALGDAFTPGPTFTNVNDFRAVLVTPKQ